MGRPMMVDELTTYIQQQGIAYEAIDLFANDQPPVPDNVISVLEEGGRTPLYTMGGVVPEYEQPRIQIMVRDVSTVNAKLRALQVKQALENVVNMTLQSDQDGSRAYYMAIIPVSEPYFMMRDRLLRYIYGFYANVQKEPSKQFNRDVSTRFVLVAP